MVRILAVGLMSILIAVQVIRNAAVRTWADSDPELAARAWAGHPDVQLSLGMIAIAESARQGQAIAPSVFEQIYAASRAAPLAPEPYLVRGVQAQLANDPLLARDVFLQAKWRDGRSLPARYFLTEHYLRQQDAARGLREIAVLARLAPDGVPKLAPFLARYAAEPGKAAQLRRVLHSEPTLDDSTLSILATNASNTDLIFALSNPQRRSSKSAWVPGLLHSLIRDRQFKRAQQTWAGLSGVRPDPGSLIYDPGFIRADAPPPFNWSLTSSTVGLAERQRGGGLHVIYYGQEDGPLAAQLLILPPGGYRLAAKAASTNQLETLRWTLICQVTNEAIASVPLDQAVRGWRFDVPANCPAQRLELGGAASDAPQQVDVTIQSLSLTRDQAGG